MLVGMTELLNVENIPDQTGLHRAWELTFGQVCYLTTVVMAPADIVGVTWHATHAMLRFLASRLPGRGPSCGS